MKKTWKRFVSSAMTAAMIVPGVLAPVSSMSAKAETQGANREGVYSIDLNDYKTAAGGNTEPKPIRLPETGTSCVLPFRHEYLYQHGMGKWEGITKQFCT